MKIYVYAIARDEEKFARRFMESMKEADGVYVLDTGSRDGTVEALRALGAHVERMEIIPWRFDRARNESMKLLPGDAELCVCADLDEVFKPGWRAKLEEAWEPGATTVRYKYVWSYTPDGREGVKFLGEKIHAPGCCRWQGAVHETLRYSLPRRDLLIPSLRMEHRPDPHKSRAGYLPLLELALEEEPQNDRNMHYLGREYMYHGQWERAVETLKKHLAMPSAAWAAERAASMRYIARCCKALGQPELAELWLNRAIAEAPDYREAYYEAELLAYEQQEWQRCAYYGERCVEIHARELSYITGPEAWGSGPYDLLAVACWRLGRREEALRAGRRAAAICPRDGRLRENVRIMEEAIHGKRDTAV